MKKYFKGIWMLLFALVLSMVSQSVYASSPGEPEEDELITIKHGGIRPR